MKKKISLLIKALVIGTLIFSQSGCFLTLVYDITVQVTNYNSLWVDVSYRESGSTTWSTPKTVYDNDTDTLKLPGPGTYDFKVEDYLYNGTYVNQTFLTEDCTIDWGSVDYYITVNSDDTVDFY